ncbi:MAG TPA: c-type cytochrome [Blastocatellia bacterium]|nr:c-type cytochrome [Blastocatellia bacterium]
MPFAKFFQYVSLTLGMFAFLLAPQTSSSDDAAQGERLFQLHCAACHGPKGEGAMGPSLAVPKLGRAANDQLLFSIIKDGIAGTEMPRSRLSSAEIQQMVAYVRKLGQLPPETATGNAKRGEQLYFAKGGCHQCHAINGHGSAFGPDLTEIGLRRGSVHLRTSLLDPEADVPKSFAIYRPGTSIADNFLQVRVVTNDGKRIKGVRVNEDTFTIQLREASGRVHSFFKSELSELHKDWGKSPMPSYRDVFSKEELDDVVAFLLSLRGEK